VCVCVCVCVSEQYLCVCVCVCVCTVLQCADVCLSQVQLLVSKYLSVNGNTLGTNELNVLGGTNLCALNTIVLNSITAASME